MRGQPWPSHYRNVTGCHVEAGTCVCNIPGPFSFSVQRVWVQAYSMSTAKFEDLKSMSQASCKYCQSVITCDPACSLRVCSVKLFLELHMYTCNITVLTSHTLECRSPSVSEATDLVYDRWPSVGHRTKVQGLPPFCLSDPSASVTDVCTRQSGWFSLSTEFSLCVIPSSLLSPFLRLLCAPD